MSDIHDSFENALTDAVSKFPKNEFIIQQVVSEDKTIPVELSTAFAFRQEPKPAPLRTILAMATLTLARV
ncbi:MULTISPECIES: hypothetical protein [Leptospira]|uniref:Uncharacterized protein n=1 Tax=Leptospira santarosai TaxID=28183 RepID=A0AB73MKG8_9LEPT|nr:MULTISPECIES: hypothetical protein [Leptospira]ONF90242.1 hypothetical protein BWD14_19885 [Leptospira santarosai]